MSRWATCPPARRGVTFEGNVEAQRVAEAIPLRHGPGQQDFPAAAADAQGAVWVAYVDHAPRGPEVLEALTRRPQDFSDFIPREGGDQIRLIRFTGGKPSAPIDVTGPGRDVGRPPRGSIPRAGSSLPGPRTRAATGTCSAAATIRARSPGRRSRG